MDTKANARPLLVGVGGRVEYDLCPLTVGKHSLLAHFDPESRAALFAQVQVRQDRYGDGRRTHTRRLTACHEAGHLIAYQLSGLKPKKAKIWRDPQHGLWFGESVHSGRTMGPFFAWEDPQFALAFAFELLAGWAAEATIGGVCDPGSSTDEIVVAQAALEGAAFGLALPYEPLHRAIGIYLSAQLETHQAAGRRLVDALEQRRKLKGWDLRRLLKTVPVVGREAVAEQIIELANDADLENNLLRALPDGLHVERA